MTNYPVKVMNGKRHRFVTWIIIINKFYVKI